MKFIHISDLHPGKRVNEFSMLEEQKYILQQVLDTVQNEDGRCGADCGRYLR